MRRVLAITVMLVIVLCADAPVRAQITQAATGTTIVQALAKLGLRVSPVVGTALTIASLPSAAASRSQAIGADTGVAWSINLLDGAVDASTGPINGERNSSAQATAKADFGIFNPVAIATTKVVVGSSAWAFAKGGLKVTFGSPADVNLDIQQAYVDPGSSILIEVNDDSGADVTRDLPVGTADQIAGATDPLNPSVHAIPTTPATWFMLSVSMGNDGSLNVVNTGTGLDPSEIITAADFTPVTTNGVKGFTFAGTRTLHLDFPTGTEKNFSAEVGAFATPEPSSAMLFCAGGLSSLLFWYRRRKVS